MPRSVFAELLPNWLKRDVVREQSSRDSLTPLQSLQSRIKMANQGASANPKERKPKTAPARSAKADPDRKDIAVAEVDEDVCSPVRDVREEPAENPNGDTPVREQ